MKPARKYRWQKLLALCLILFFPAVLVFRLLLPDPLFREDYSTVLFDRQGYLLSARTASDGQWRFAPADSVPEKFKKALLLFEDQYFYIHPGVNPVSLLEALADNVRAGRVVRGGSTLTMQVIRLTEKGKPRTLLQKVKEVFSALALETKYSKEDILKFYCAHAPFGGNVVGLSAAGWRYFGRPVDKLSWAEASLLAVLPNAPSLIHPGKNRDVLLAKRNKLLLKLYQKGYMKRTDYELALLEPVPDRPQRLPDKAPHLTEFLKKRHFSTAKTTLDRSLQEAVENIVNDHYKHYRENEVYNIAVLVVTTGNKAVVAYVGNTQGKGNHGFANDMVIARRSSGSILKPFLFAAALQDGQILQHSLIPDIPSYFKGYHPQNFDLTFEGAVKASDALSRSRNVPAVYLLRDYGIGRFLEKLKELGFTTFRKTADHYGLSLILGGGEVSLYELVSAYAGMGKSLLNYDRFYGKYSGKEYDKPKVMIGLVEDKEKPLDQASVPLNAGAVWLTFDALYQVKRPDEMDGWEYFASSENVAWKTGTSFGFKDAWAVGVTADYTVGVWVGNADGQGRTGMTGTKYAAPLMFEVFDKLKTNQKFERPEDDLTELVVCKKSGYRASRFCPEKDTMLACVKGLNVKICDDHRLVFTDTSGKYRVTSRCMPVDQMKKQVYFVLPPVQAWYYAQTHPDYKTLPPFKPGCSTEQYGNRIKFVYPVSGTKIFVPKNEEGKPEPVVLEVSHLDPAVHLYWHLDNKFLGTTQRKHTLAVVLPPGKHFLTVVDEYGTQKKVYFEVVNK